MDHTISTFETLCSELDITPKQIADEVFHLRIGYHLGDNFGERFTAFITIETLKDALLSAKSVITAQPSKVQMKKIELRNAEQGRIGAKKCRTADREDLWSYQRNALLRISFLQPFVYLWVLEVIQKYEKDSFKDQMVPLDDIYHALLELFRDDLNAFDELVLRSVDRWLMEIKQIGRESGSRQALISYLKCLCDNRVNEQFIDSVYIDYTAKMNLLGRNSDWDLLLNAFLNRPAASFDELRMFMQQNYQIPSRAPMGKKSDKNVKRYSIDELKHINWLNYGDYIN
jgi:hypothetical protein